MSGSYLPKAVRAEGRRKGHADQIEAIGQHGENTILRLQSGDLPMPIVSPAEEQLFRGLGRTPPQSGGQARAPSGGASVRSRLSSESWGSFQSNSASELRRIHELGDKARAIGKKTCCGAPGGALAAAWRENHLRHCKRPNAWQS